MKQIRKNTFETNSSSTHSLIMCSKDDFELFKKGELYYCHFAYGNLKTIYGFESDNFYAKDEVEKACKELNWERKIYFISYEEFFSNNDLESFESNYITKGGEEVIAFGRYGFDG